MPALGMPIPYIRKLSHVISNDGRFAHFHPPKETFDWSQGVHSWNTLAGLDVRAPRIWQSREPLHDWFRLLDRKHAHDFDVDHELLDAPIVVGTEIPAIVSASNTNCAALPCR